MGDKRHYTLMLLDALEPGDYPVRVEGIYRVASGGWLFDFTASAGERVLGASPALAVVGTDIGDKAEDLKKIHGLKVPLPAHIRRVVGGSDLWMLPVKRLLFSRDCTLEVGGEMDAPPLSDKDRPPQLATLTTTS